MGNCLQGSDSDDATLVHSEEHDDQPSHAPSCRGSRSHDSHVNVGTRNAYSAGPSVYENFNALGIANDSGHLPTPSLFYHPSPGVSRLAHQLTEEEQVKIAQRIGLIQHLPVDVYLDDKKADIECAICMIEFALGDRVRFLRCMHTFHVKCIDDWLMRSFTCPSCLESVDSALAETFQVLNNSNQYANSSNDSDNNSVATVSSLLVNLAGTTRPRQKLPSKNIRMSTDHPASAPILGRNYSNFAAEVDDNFVDARRMVASKNEATQTAVTCGGSSTVFDAQALMFPDNRDLHLKTTVCGWTPVLAPVFETLSSPSPSPRSPEARKDAATKSNVAK